jgi:hypothetical protein
MIGFDVFDFSWMVMLCHVQQMKKVKSKQKEKEEQSKGNTHADVYFRTNENSHLRSGPWPTVSNQSPSIRKRYGMVTLWFRGNRGIMDGL